MEASQDNPHYRRWDALILSTITADETAAEPLLRPEPERLALFPLRDEKIFEFRKILERLHWVAEEVDCSRDPEDWRRAEPEDRQLLAHVLAFFAVADDLVLEGLDGRLARTFPSKEVEFYLRAQADQECVHSEVYSKLVQQALPEGPRAAAFHALRSYPSVAHMAAWVRWWTGRPHAPADLVAAMAFIEGALFSGFFAAIHHFRRAGEGLGSTFPGITSANEFICRDEGVHSSFWCFLLRERFVRRPDPAVIAAIARETASLSEKFFAEALPEPTPAGLSAPPLGQYVRSVADSVAVLAGYEPVFGDPNPFPFMESLALNRVAKTNFFEHQVSSYQGPQAGASTFRLVPGAWAPSVRSA
jgi:ribonucleotide reductase beta subunit family protein with ferritin-like domain